MKFLKDHPFAVEAFFDSSLVLSFAVPKEQLDDLIPECLQLDTFQDKWAFIAVAIVQTKQLRPRGFPKFLGRDFILIGHRVFVRYTNNAGKRLRGLFIIKSETNKKSMELMGNIFTHYSYTTTDLNLNSKGDLTTIKSERSQFEIVIEQSNDNVELPEGSPFSDWRNARKFAGPLPFTFTYDEKERTVLIIEGVRQNWKPEPVKIMSYRFEFLNSLNLQRNMVLANAFEVKNIPYYWKKGKVEKWK